MESLNSLFENAENLDDVIIGIESESSVFINLDSKPRNRPIGREIARKVIRVGLKVDGP